MSVQISDACCRRTPGLQWTVAPFRPLYSRLKWKSCSNRRQLRQAKETTSKLNYFFYCKNIYKNNNYRQITWPVESLNETTKAAVLIAVFKLSMATGDSTSGMGLSLPDILDFSRRLNTTVTVLFAKLNWNKTTTKKQL